MLTDATYLSPHADLFSPIEVEIQVLVEVGRPQGAQEELLIFAFEKDRGQLFTLALLQRGGLDASLGHVEGLSGGLSVPEKCK